MDGQFSAVALEDLFHDGQSQAGPSGLPGAGPIHTVETLREAGEVALFDPFTVVLYAEIGSRVVAIPAYLDLGLFWGVLDGVEDEVAE